jgi:hypothetical protein
MAYNEYHSNKPELNRLGYPYNGVKLRHDEKVVVKFPDGNVVGGVIDLSDQYEYCNGGGQHEMGFNAKVVVPLHGVRTVMPIDDIEVMPLQSPR